jgi:hypothetical protein
MSVDGLAATVRLGFVSLGCWATAEVPHKTAPIMSNVTFRMISPLPMIAAYVLATSTRNAVA